MNYIVYKGNKILRTGSCPASMLSIQAKQGQMVKEGVANDRTQKMQGDQVVNKTPVEIEADNPTPVPVPEEDREKNVKNKDWNALEARVAALE